MLQRDTRTSAENWSIYEKQMEDLKVQKWKSTTVKLRTEQMLETEEKTYRIYEPTLIRRKQPD